MSLPINTIFIFSKDQAKIQLLEKSINDLCKNDGICSIKCKCLREVSELNEYFESFELNNYYFIDYDLLQSRDRTIHSALGKEFNICVFSDIFHSDIALFALDNGYDQYFSCDDLVRFHKIVRDLIYNNGYKGLNYSKLVHLMVESADISGILNMVLDSSLNISSSDLGFSILKRNLDDLHGASLSYYSKGIPSNLISEANDYIFAFKDRFISEEFYIPDEKESKELAKRLSIFQDHCFGIFNLHMGALYDAILVLSRNKPFNNNDIDLLLSMVSVYKVFLKNYERYENTKLLTYVDDLTTVYNRRYLERFICGLIDRSANCEDRFSMIFLDIDNLKEVNNKYGHLIGSRVIKTISEILKLSVRGFDRVFRFGGDEFAVILPYTDTEGALYVADRIKNTIKNKPIVFEEADIEDLSMSVTMGIATYPEHGESPSELISNSDKAMFSAKQKGKNRIEKYRKRN